jgi:antitoxin HicB
MSVLADDAVRHYLGLPYRIVLTRDDEADDARRWRAAVEELPGCEARGSTPTEAAARVPAALAEWVAAAQAEGREIPEPGAGRAYSGKLLLRMPQSLHADLAEAAEREQVSLNAYINGLLSGAIHWKQPPSPMIAHDRAGDEPSAAAVERTIRLQRFLAAALAANLAVVAIAAAVALDLLL